MKQFRILAAMAVLMAVAACETVESSITDPVAMEQENRGVGKLITFALYEDEGTKAPTPLTSLSSFNVSATSGAAGSEVSKLSNVTFSSAGGGKFTSGVYWPETNPNYSFYASNAQMSHTTAGQTVTVSSIDLDVVCAYLALASVKYKEQNTLVFNHILARVGKVEFANTGLVTEVKLTMKYSGGGTYNIRTDTWEAGEKSTKELTATDNANFWIVPGTYEVTLSYKDANGAAQTKKTSQEFAAGKVNNITAKLDGSVVVKTEDIYEAPTFTLGTISDVPAGGGDSGAPSVTAVGQRKRVKKTLADGTVKYDPDWTAVSNPDYTIQYGTTLSTLSDNCPSYHGDNLGTTAKARTPLGNIYVLVSANGLDTEKSTEVYQQANEETLGDISVTAFSYAPKVGAAGGEASPTVTYKLPYSWTSGSSGKYTTGATLAYSTVTDNAGATLNNSTGKVSWAANKDAARSEKEKVTVSLKGKSGSKEAITEQDGDAVSSYDAPTVTLSYAGTPIAYNSTAAISPTLTVKQKINYASGKTETLTLSSSDYTVSYSGSVPGLSVNSSTGVVSPSSNAGAVIAAKTEYGKPSITAFSYSNIAYWGGSSSPSISYTQTNTEYAAGRKSTGPRSTTVMVTVTAHGVFSTAAAGIYQNGDNGVSVTSSTKTVKSGGTVYYSGSAAKFTLNGSSGNVTAENNTGSGGSKIYGNLEVKFTAPTTTFPIEGSTIDCSLSYSQAITTTARESTPSRSISVKAYVILNGKSSDEKQASCIQNGDPGAQENTIYQTDKGKVEYSFSGSANGFTSLQGSKVKAAKNTGSSLSEYDDPVFTSCYFPDVPAKGGDSYPQYSFMQNHYTGRKSTSSRTCTYVADVTLNGKKGSASITFTQPGDPGERKVSEVITSGVSPSCKIPEGWVSIWSQGKYIWWSENKNAGARSADVEVKLTSYGKTATVTVKSRQEGTGVDPISYYDDPEVIFSYLPENLEVTGGSSTPVVTYSQTAHHVSGATSTITSGGEVSYAGSAPGFSLKNDGTVEATANTGDARSITVTAIVVVNNKVGSDKATVSQDGDSVSYYDDPEVTVSYSPAKFEVAGGSSTPSVTYSQTVHYASGATSTITSGGKVSYSGSASGFTLKNDGTVEATANTGDARSITVTATVEVNNKTGSNTVTVSQDGDSVSYYDAPVVTVSYSPAKFDAVGGTATPSVTYSQTAHHVSGATSTITSGGTVSYTGSAQGFTLKNDGSVEATANTGDARGITVTATVLVNGKKGSNTATVSQDGDSVSYYDDPKVMVSYSPANFDAVGGTAIPSVTYNQTVHYASGATSPITSGGKVSYTGSASGFTLDTGNGKVKVAANTGGTRSITVTAIVEVNNKTGNGFATVSQASDAFKSIDVTCTVQDAAKTVTGHGENIDFSLLSGHTQGAEVAVNYTVTGTLRTLGGASYSVATDSSISVKIDNNFISGGKCTRYEVEGDVAELKIYYLGELVKSWTVTFR